MEHYDLDELTDRIVRTHEGLEPSEVQIQLLDFTELVGDRFIVAYPDEVCERVLADDVAADGPRADDVSKCWQGPGVKEVPRKEQEGKELKELPQLTYVMVLLTLCNLTLSLLA